MAPKKKKKELPPPEPEIDETLINAQDLEPEPEEVQFTDTSYTSASFESLPPIVIDEKPKKKKKKKGEEEVIEVKSEVFNWSEDSLPVIEEEEKKPIVIETFVEKKKAKGKKKKDKGPVEEIPEFEKPKNWKKMNKKERDLWMEQRIEEWRIEMEAEKQAKLAGAKEKKLALARERAELMVKDNAEQEIRRDILQMTVNLLEKFERQKFASDNKQQKLAEWLQFLRCDGLPDPRVSREMSTYLHLWRNSDKYDDKELARRCEEALPMLELLDEINANSRQYTPLQAQTYNEVRLALRVQLSNAIEMASFTILRDIERNMNWLSVRVADYQKEFKGLRLNLWVAVTTPSMLPKPIEPERAPIELSFPAMRVSLKLPKTLPPTRIVVRASRSMVDLLSESTRTFALWADRANRFEDLFSFNVKEHISVHKVKLEQDAIRTKFYKDIREKVRELEAFLKANQYTKNEEEKDALDNLNLMEPPFLPDPRTFIGEEAEKAFKKYLKKCLVRTRTGEVNLRKYRICGGVLYMDLLTTPPQPKRMRGDIAVSTLQLPISLVPLKFQVQYRAPGPPPEGVIRKPEEIEAENKQIEAAYQKLAYINIELSQDQMWFEPPVICQWQVARKLWTSNYVNDYKFNDVMLHLSFRTGVLWPIGIATLRYSNLPYQGWDIRPDPKGRGVIVTVTGQFVTVTWMCVGSNVRLKYIANATSSALREHFGKSYSVTKMTKIMREASCDFFPDFDAHNHIEETCPKEWVIERHNYHAMACLSRAYNFQWSKWNAGAGSRNIVIQLREAIDKKREGKFQLLYANPQRALILKCTELSPEFSVEPMAGLPFFPDLFTLNMKFGSVDARRTTFGMKYRLVETVFGLLQELKLCSFS